MKATKTTLLIAALTLTAGLTSCKKKGCTDPTASNYSEEAKKDDGSCTFDDPYTADFKSFYDQNREDAKQTFTIDPTIWNEVVGNGGVRLTIPANSFVDGGGAPITGSVTIELIEVLTQKDMFFLNATTSADNNEILVSGGSVNVTASVGGSPVFLDAGASVGLFVPYMVEDPNMGIFDGAEDATTGDVVWTEEVPTTTTVPDTSGGFTGYYYYDWQDSDLGWVNCDYFWDDPNPKSGLKVNVDDPYGWDNTEIVIHFSSIESCVPGYTNSSDPSEKSYYIYSVPETAEMTVIAIAEISGSYYSAFVPVVMTTDLEIDITLAPTTMADIEAAVEAL